MNNEKSYIDRQSVRNIGEDLFEQYCREKDYWFQRIGFDEKLNNVPHFYELNPLLRNLPDYLVYRDDELMLVNVKGTPNIKKEEMALLPWLAENYASKKVHLYYAFCFKDKKPRVFPYWKVIEMFDKEKDKKWHDGKVYRTLGELK